jgi:predicted porin
MRAAIAAADGPVEETLRRVLDHPRMEGLDLTCGVTTSEAYETLPRGERRFRILAYDFGVKRNSLRLLSERGCHITTIPATTPAEEIIAHNADGGSLKNDINQGINGARESYVGLKGNWGTVIGGYIYSPADDFNSGYDGLSNSGLLSARSNMLNDGGFSTKVDDTIENAVAYISPSFSGLTVRGVFGLGEQTSGPKEKKYALGAEYERGPFKTAVVHHYIDNRGGTAEDLRETAFGVGYDFGFAKLLGTFVTKKATDGGRDKSWALGTQIPAGPGTVRLSYAKLDMSKDSGDEDAKGWTAAYFYEISKRTTIYTGYHTLDNGDLASYKHERLTGLSAGSDARLMTLGMRHKF